MTGRGTTPSATADTGSRRRTRRGRVPGWLAVGLLVVLTAVVLAWRSPTAQSTSALDPANPSPNGAQAVARVLAEQGVDVTIARGESELERAGIGPGTSVVVTRTGDLAEATIGRLGRLSHRADRLVVVDPDAWVVRYLQPDVDVVQRRRSADDFTIDDPACRTADVRTGDRLSHTQSEFRQRTGSPPSACLTHDGYSVYLAVAATARHPDLVLFGSSSAVTNQEVAEQQNAAVVLRMLGHSPRLVWYVPAISDVATTDTSRSEQLLPPWLAPGTLLGAVAVLAVMLWRGRRLGRLVREPLPVVIRAIETTQSRGGIYRRAGDTSRAAAILREATTRRLAAYLGLPPRGAGHTLVSSVWAATGRPPDQVNTLLFGPPPATEAHLLSLAAELTALEKEVHRR